MTDLPFNSLQLMREHPEKMRVPGGLLTKQGAQDYVGSVLAITGTLFFNDAHTPAVRLAICECFEEYQALAREYLTWLWRSEPTEGPDHFAYKKAPTIRDMVKRMGEDDLLSLAYTSGEREFDAGEWEFKVFARRGWEAKMKVRGTSALRFSFPMLYVEQNPTAFQAMFVRFARKLQAIHGYGGHGLVLSAVRMSDNQPFEAFLAEQLLGLDAGHPVAGATHAHLGIKTVSWLTAVNHEMVEKVGGLARIRSELPARWFALYDYGQGLVVQAGPKPEGAPADSPKPARLVLPNMLFAELRTPKVSLHYASKHGESRLIGWGAEQWLKRLDIEDDETLTYKQGLLDEPALDSSSTLPDRL